MSRTNDTPLEEVEQRNVVIYCTYAGIPVPVRGLTTRGW